MKSTVQSFVENSANQIKTFVRINVLLILFNIHQISQVICDSFIQNRVRTVLRDLADSIYILDCPSEQKNNQTVTFRVFDLMRVISRQLL